MLDFQKMLWNLCIRFNNIKSTKPLDVQRILQEKQTVKLRKVTDSQNLKSNSWWHVRTAKPDSSPIAMFPAKKAVHASIQMTKRPKTNAYKGPAHHPRDSRKKEMYLTIDLFSFGGGRLIHSRLSHKWFPTLSPNAILEPFCRGVFRYSSNIF